MPLSIDWYFVFFFFTGSLGLVVACILYFLNHNKSLAPRLLAVYLLIMSLLVIINSLTFTNFFLAFPHLWRVFGFTHFLAPAIAYLYVYAVVNQSFSLHRRDYLLFIPALVYTLCLLPFYLLPTESKLEVIKQFMTDRALISLEPETLILKSWSIPAKLAFGILLLFGQYRLLAQWRRNKLKTAYQELQNSITYRWLFLFTKLVSIFYLVLIVEYSFHISRILNLSTVICLTFSLNILFICIYLFTRPSILYGFKGWFQEGSLGIASTPFESAAIVPAKKSTLTIEQGENFRQKLENYFEDQQPYTKAGYRIRDLSAALDIPLYLLSAFINQEYGKNFNELLNDYRIAYLTEMAKNTKDFHQYTLDALSHKAGFNSRTTFISAVKKRTNQNPSDYFTEVSAKTGNQ
jgi:AraC-like DNA-binding protein